MVGKPLDLTTRYATPVRRIAPRAQLAGAVPASQGVLADADRTRRFPEEQAFVGIWHCLSIA